MGLQNRGVDQDIRHLNDFLQNELSSVETYGQCIEKIDNAVITSSLAELQSSHRRRADLLASKVRELGGTPEESSGVWGSISKMMTGGAKMFGDKAAMSALEQGEDRGRDSYLEHIEELSPACQSFVNTEILPEQLRTHDLMKSVRDTLH